MSGLGTMYKPARQIKHQCWERSCKAAASGSVKREMAGRPEVGAQISLAPRSVCQRFLPICNCWTNFPVPTRLVVPFKRAGTARCVQAIPFPANGVRTRDVDLRSMERLDMARLFFSCFYKLLVETLTSTVCMHVTHPLAGTLRNWMKDYSTDYALK